MQKQHIFFTYSFVGRDLGCRRFSGIMKRTAMNVNVELLCSRVYSLSATHPGMIELGMCQCPFQYSDVSTLTSTLATPAYILSRCESGFLFVHMHARTVAMIAKSIEHIFQYLFTISTSSYMCVYVMILILEFHVV